MRPEKFYLDLADSDKMLDMLEEWCLLPDLEVENARETLRLG